MTLQTKFASVWDAIEDTPAHAACLKARSDMLLRIQEVMRGWGMPAAAAAHRLGITEPRLDDLVGGHINRFTLDQLVKLAMSAGLQVAWTITPRAVGATGRSPATLAFREIQDENTGS